MATLRQLRDRKRQLELMRYRKKTGTRVPKSDTKGATQKAIAWVAERLTVINKQIKEKENK